MKKLLSHTAIALVAAFVLTGCSSAENNEIPSVSDREVEELVDFYQGRSSGSENPMFVAALEYAWDAMTYSQKGDICFLWEVDPSHVKTSMRSEMPDEYNERDLQQFFDGVC